MSEGVAHALRRRAPLAVVVLGLVLPLVWLCWARLLVPSDGTLLLPSPATWHGGVLVEQVLPGSELRPGDLVVAVDGVPAEAWFTGAPARELQVGDVLDYTVRRHAQEIAVPVTLRRYDLGAAARLNLGIGVLLGLVLLLTSGVFLARPRDPAARAMYAVAVLLATASSTFPLGLQVVDLLDARRASPYLVGDVAAALFWGALLHFTAVFPSPGGIARRWLGVLSMYLLPLVLYGGYLALRLPDTQEDLARQALLLSVSAPAARTVPLLALGTIVWTYRQTTNADDRRRLSWVLGTFLVGFTAYLGLGQLPSAIAGEPLVSWQWLLLALVPVPLAIAAGILRYRLFDLEVILTRSLLYGSMTVAVGSAYALAFLIFRGLPGASRPLVSFAAGIAVAASFYPLRLRLHRRVTQLIYGDRDDPYEVVSRIDRLDVGESLDRVLPAVVETLARALRLPYAGIELAGVRGAVHTTSFGHADRAPARLPLQRHGQPLGNLLLDVGHGKEPFGPADRRLLEDVAHRVGEAAYSAMLFADLQHSREGLLVAREEERRRLRRDLHDGVGPSLAAIGMQLDVLQDLIPVDPQAAAALAERVSGSTRGLVADVRRIVDGLAPTALDRLGLAEALRERLLPFDASHVEASPGNMHVSLEVDGDLSRLSAAVELAAFRIANEAVTNALRHSGARLCVVRLRREGQLLVEILDDGRGLPTRPRRGVGLSSMRERALELGGSLIVQPGPSGTGTLVTARLPLHPT